MGLVGVDTRKFNRLTPGITREPAPAIHDVPQIGKALQVDPAGVMVALAVMPGLILGPAPWCLGAEASSSAAIAAGFAPQVGDWVLIAFAGNSADNPVVTAWWR